MVFRPASKKLKKARIAIIGPSGSGKTWTALAIAKGLSQGQKIALIDTEHRTSQLYSDVFSFDCCDLEDFDPLEYVKAIEEAENEGYGVIIIDSLSHAWMGKGGALEQVNAAAKRSQSNNQYVAWRDVTPRHNMLVDAIIRSKCHIVATMRAKTEYVIEKAEGKGKTTVRKVGIAPIQREGLEYEFDLVADMTIEHDFIVGKTRLSMFDGLLISKPDEKIGLDVVEWLQSGAVEDTSPMRNENTRATKTRVKTASESQAVDVHSQENAREVESSVYEYLKKDGLEITASRLATVLNLDIDKINKAIHVLFSAGKIQRAMMNDSVVIWWWTDNPDKMVLSDANAKEEFNRCVGVLVETLGMDQVMAADSVKARALKTRKAGWTKDDFRRVTESIIVERNSTPSDVETVMPF